MHFSQDAIAELTDLSTKVFQIVDDAYVLFQTRGEAHLEQRSRPRRRSSTR